MQEAYGQPQQVRELLSRQLIEAEGREEPDASPVTSGARLERSETSKNEREAERPVNGPNNAESPVQYWRAKIRRIFVRQYEMQMLIAVAVSVPNFVRY